VPIGLLIFLDKFSEAAALTQLLEKVVFSFKSPEKAFVPRFSMT
jgi:hypothetical protein